MGYELHIARADLALTGSQLVVSLTVTNTGVAPFYCDWPVELAALDAKGRRTALGKPDWKLSGILPGEPSPLWRFSAEMSSLPGGMRPLLLRVLNLLANGLPLRFAHQSQDRHLPGWLTLGEFKPSPASRL
jgi:hypothetical protein